MKYLFLGFLLLNLTGCIAYKDSPAFDSSLTVDGKEFARRSKLSIEYSNDKISNLNMIELNNKVKKYFLNEGDSELVIKGLKQKYPFGKCLQGFEPMLLVVTLGVIPQICEQEYTLKVQFNNLNKSENIEKTLLYKTKGIVGWVSFLYAISSNYKMVKFRESSNEDSAALFSVINKSVAGQ